MHKNKKYLFIFLLIGAIVYLPILFNGFVWDDFPYILNNFNSQHITIQTMFGSSIFNSGSFYRPIPSLLFGEFYALFGTHALYYHIAQLVLHVVGTYLLFIFFLIFFSEEIACICALLFLVHPINVESVAYISSTTSELYFLLGMGALLISVKRHLTNTNIVTMFFLVFLTLLTKETGFLFLFLILFYRCLFKLDKLKTCIVSGVGIGVIYALLRLFVGGVTLSSVNLDIPIRNLQLVNRLLNIPAVILYYLKTFLFPLHLSIWQFWLVKSVTYSNFYLPLLLCSIFMICIFCVAFLLYKRQATNKMNKDQRFEIFLFFSGWYVIGMVLLLQIIPLDMTVADRWFYFPIVGLLGMIGFGLQTFHYSYVSNKKILVISACVIMLFSVRTFIRTFDWKSNLSLYSHDVKERPENFMLMDQLAIVLYQDGKLDEALNYENNSIVISPTVTNLNHLGVVYQGKKQYAQAISAFVRAIQTYKSLPNGVTQAPKGFESKADVQLESVYENLAYTYHLVNQPEDIINLLTKEALKKFPSSSRLYLYLALAEHDVNNDQEALKAITKSYDLSPDATNSYIYNRLKNNLPIQDAP